MNLLERARKQLKLWAEPLAIFIAMRVGFAMLALFGGILIPAVARNAAALYTAPPLNRWAERLFSVWSHWDGEWFLQIATRGYNPTDGTTAFFPLYPLCLKIVGILLGGGEVSYLLAGVLVSALATIALFILFYELARRELPRELAGRAVFYLAIFPTTFFFSAIYTESLFLALVIGAFLAARHWQKWWLAGLLAGLAALTRSIGIALIIPLAWEWWRQNRPIKIGYSGTIKGIQLNLVWEAVRNRAKPPVLWLALPVIAVAGWAIANLLMFGDPLNFTKIQSQPPWNRSFAFPWSTLSAAVQIFFTNRGADGFLPTAAREDSNLIDFPFFVFFLIMFLVACWQCWHGKMPLSFLLYFGIGLVFPLLSPNFKLPLFSFPRFGLVLFPVFLMLAQWSANRRWVHYLYTYIALLLLSLFFVRFANWYWIA
jgi:Mannosyltransferase (PIG-V)